MSKEHMMDGIFDDLGTIVGNHLHFEVIDSITNESIDPVQFWIKYIKSFHKSSPVPEPSTLIIFFSGLVEFVRLKKNI